MPVSTDAGSAAELSSRLSCIPSFGIEYSNAPLPVVRCKAEAGAALFCFATAEVAEYTNLEKIAHL